MNYLLMVSYSGDVENEEYDSLTEALRAAEDTFGNEDKAFVGLYQKLNVRVSVAVTTE